MAEAPRPQRTGLFREVGSSGLTLQQGQFLQTEFQRELIGQQGVRVYTEMASSSVLGAILFVIKQMVTQVEWKVNPFTDEDAEDEPKPADKDSQQFVQQCIDDMSHSFGQLLEEICSMFTYGWCLPPDQIVLRGDGTPVPISEIKLGDQVLTANGRPRRVTKIYTRPYQGDLIAIKARGYPNRIRLTPEHKVPIGDDWKRADELTVGDRLKRPRLKLEAEGNYDSGWLVGLYLAEGHIRKDSVNTVCFSIHRKEAPEVKRRLDLWAEQNAQLPAETIRAMIASGATYRAMKPYSYSFINRIRNGETVVRRTQAAITYPADQPNSANISFSIKEFRKLIADWVVGNSAETKSLRQFPTDSAFGQGLIDGWHWGDGHQGYHQGKWTKAATTVSLALAHQMQIIAGSLGIPAPISVSKPSSRKSFIRGREMQGKSLAYNVGLVAERLMSWKRHLLEDQARALHAQEMSLNKIRKIIGVSYVTIHRWFHSSGPKRQGFQCAVEPDHVTHEITNVSRESYSGTVYDLEVEEDHTFCAGPFAVSNCFLEIVYKARLGAENSPPSKFDDRKIGWRKIALRGQETLSGWDMDENGGIRGMIQEVQYPETKKVTIPIEKALLFRTDATKNNPEGRSILRNAYRSWFYAKRFEEIEAVGIERDLAGLPVLTPPEDIDLWNPRDPEMVAAHAAAIKLLQQIRRGEKEGLLLPNGWKLELLASGSRRQFDLNETITRHETRQAMSVLADFVFLGQGKTGSWALSSDKTDLFLLALKGFLISIKEVFNRHAIPRLLDLNGMDLTRPPTLTHGDIETQNLAELAAYLKSLYDIGFIMFPDEGLERHARLIAGLPPPPKRDEEELELRMPTEEPVVEDPEKQEAFKRILKYRQLMRDEQKKLLNGHAKE